jgi:hypothetical protein
MENKNNYIEFVVEIPQGDDKFQIPTFGRKVGFDWVVNFGYDAYKHFSSKDGKCDEFFIPLEPGRHTIRIEPYDEPTVGWARAFGCGADINGYGTKWRNMIVEVLNDPDWAHLESETATGDDFRYAQYGGCTRLTHAPDEVLPDSVESIGNSFRYYQYNNCTSLTKAPDETLPDSVESIGNNFRKGQYAYCNNLTKAPTKVLPDSVKSIGDNFRYAQYADCTRLTHAPAEQEQDWEYLDNDIRAFAKAYLNDWKHSAGEKSIGIKSIHKWFDEHNLMHNDETIHLVYNLIIESAIKQFERKDDE